MLDAFFARTFAAGDAVTVRTSHVFSTRTLQPYSLYSLPFCAPHQLRDEPLNLGEVLQGTLVQDAPFELRFGVSQLRALCMVRLDRDATRSWARRIREGLGGDAGDARELGGGEPRLRGLRALRGALLARVELRLARLGVGERRGADAVARVALQRRGRRPPVHRLHPLRRLLQPEAARRLGELRRADARPAAALRTSTLERLKPLTWRP